MKKIISIMIILVMILCFASCSSGEKATQNDNTESTTVSTTEKLDYSGITTAYNNLLVEKCDEVEAEYGEDELDFHPTYMVPDINGDGIHEIIIKTGVNEEEYVYQIYAYDPTSETAVLVGEKEGAYSAIYNGDTGIFIIKTYKNSESKFEIAFDGEKATFNTIYENKHVQHYSIDNESLLSSATASDNALLDNLIDD